MERYKLGCANKAVIVASILASTRGDAFTNFGRVTSTSVNEMEPNERATYRQSTIC